jgi:hypothetical protein
MEQKRQKKRWYVTTSISLIILCVLLIMSNINSHTTDKQFMTIIVSVDGDKQEFIFHISEQGKNFEKKNLKTNPNDMFDLSNVVKLVKEYEAKGWKSVNSTMQMPAIKDEHKLFLYFFLQRDTTLKK